MTLIDKAEALAAIDAWFAETKSFAPPSLREAIAALPARGVGVPESLRKFLRHDGLCGIVGGYGYCTCGLDAALAPTDAAQAEITAQALSDMARDDAPFILESVVREREAALREAAALVRAEFRLSEQDVAEKTAWVVNIGDFVADRILALIGETRA